jgi:hypothetical protein
MTPSAPTLATLIPIAALALACTKPHSPDVPADDANTQGSLPTPVRPESRPIAANEAMLVEQLGIGSPTTWRFEPGGSRIAGSLEYECGVWQLGTGDHLGTADTHEPCETWTPLEPIDLVEGTGSATVAHPDGQRQLVLAGDRFELSGSKPIQGRVRGERRYRAAAFSPDGARMALFVGSERGPLQIDVWNLDSGRLERELSFERHEELLAKRFWLRWDADSLIAIAHMTPPACDPASDPTCDGWIASGWMDAHVVQIWPAIEAEPTRVSVPSYPGEERVEQLFADPERRWLFALTEGMEPREGTGFTFHEIPLRGEEQTGLSWYAPTLDGTSAPLGSDKTRMWSSFVGSSFIEVQDYSASYGSWTTVLWDMLSLTAQGVPDMPIQLQDSQGILLDGEVGEHAWRIGLAGRDILLGETDHCPAQWLIDQAKDAGETPPPCEQTRIAPEGCAAVDASWQFDRVLIACQDRWLLAPTPESLTVDVGAAQELARGTGEPRQVVWGPGGLAIWTFGEGLRLFQGEQLVRTNTGVIDLHRAVLDEELDLALVREREGLRVLDLDGALFGPTLAWKDRVEFAAFAPDRSQLAVAGEGELAVFLLSESQPVARWRTGKLAGLAFRQDGEVLFVGATRPLPELALDPSSGEQVEAAQLDAEAFDRIADAQLDPSWRWAIEEDGTILRTIDGEALVMLGTEAIAESGWFVGPPHYFSRYRVRIGPGSLTPVYTVEELAQQLARPNLVAEFFAGRPLPRPTLKPPSDQPAGSR